MKKYIGRYSSLENIKFPSLEQTKIYIEEAGGYYGDVRNGHFEEYETAYIAEYNSIGRNIATYYFSMRDKKWHRSTNSVLLYSSWDNAKKPFKIIAQFLLYVCGFKEREDKRTADLIQKVKNMLNS